MISIAFLEPHLKCVGGIRRIIEVSNRLVALGNKVTIFTPKGRPCFWLPCSATILKLSELKNYTFDIALFNLAEQYEIALAAKAKKKVFWVLAPEALYKNPDIPLKALKQDFYFLANSKFTVKYIKERRKVEYEIPIISGGINPSHFKYDPKVTKKYHVIYYGSSRPWKGTQLIEASLAGTNFRALKMEGLDTPQHELYKLYNSADLCVVANQCEGFSFVELEAMACGTPVLCTNSGGNMDYLLPNENALVVRRDIVSIREGMTSLLHDKNKMRKFKDVGLRTAGHPKFSWDNITVNLNNIFLGLLK